MHCRRFADRAMDEQRRHGGNRPLRSTRTPRGRKPLLAGECVRSPPRRRRPWSRSPAHPQAPAAKFARMRAPCSVCANLGMEQQRVEAASRIRHRRDRRIRTGGEDGEPGGSLSHDISMTGPDPESRPAPPRTSRRAPARLPRRARTRVPAHGRRHLREQRSSPACRSRSRAPVPPQVKIAGSHRGAPALERLAGPPDRITPAAPLRRISSAVIVNGTISE